jgi:hypothetical protein
VNGVLVDTNVLIDVSVGDPTWGDWSAAALRAALDESVVVINPIVYGELAAGFSTVEALDALVPEDLYRREAIPYPAAFLAGVAHREVRRRGSPRPITIADLFIGAHAAVAGYRLLTRNARRYRTYFPRLELITPHQSE